MDDISVEDSYQYSSRSTTPGLDILTSFPSSPALYLNKYLPNRDASHSGSQLFSGSSEDWSSPVEVFSPHPFRFNNSRSSSLSAPMPHPNLPDVEQCRQCSSLKRDNLVLTTENRTLKNAYNSLVRAVPALLQAPAGPLPNTNTLPISTTLPALGFVPLQPAIPAAKQSDYPLAGFWFRHDWKTHEDLKKGESNTDERKPRGSSRAAQGINVTMLYVTDAQGNVIDGFRATSIRQLAIKLFNRLADRGLAPASWNRGGIDLQRSFSAEICEKFPEMGLCADDWKVQYMATKMYSSWHTGYFSSNNRVIKSEDGTSDGFKSKSAKRSHHDSSSSNKRTKVDTNVAPAAPEENNREVPIDNVDVGITSHTKEDAQPATAAAAPAQLKIINPLLSGLPVPTTPVLAATTPVPAATMPVLATTALNNTTPATTTSAAPNSAEAAPAVPPVAQVIEDHTDVHGAGGLGTTEGAGGLVPEAPPHTSKARTRAPRAAAKPTKEKKTTPGPSKTPRNLCLIDWCQRNPGGLTSQYRVYWDSIENTSEAEQWIQASADAGAAKTKAAS
ncbi:hypothetical protein B0H10DRAFT_2439970 [Mycena sp. CBHHK59/15]|nr:hypothetical protein B0H10DRAFT_2439970 [Mycena sp. CBHHK59/15]